MAKFTSIRTLLAISAQLGLQVRQMDVDTAFLNAPISEDIWVKVPNGTELPDGDDGISKLCLRFLLRFRFSFFSFYMG